MTRLDDKARGTFVKLCGRLESSHHGEVLAAAGQLKRFLREHKLSWEDVIGIKGTPTRPQISSSRQGDLLRVKRALENPLFLTTGEKQRLSALCEALSNGLELSPEEDRFLALMFVRAGV